MHFEVPHRGKTGRWLEKGHRALESNILFYTITLGTSPRAKLAFVSEAPSSRSLQAF